MSKDDYFVLAYKLLAYLYDCLKSGESPDMEYLDYDTKAFPIHEAYWHYLLTNLYKDGYIEGIAIEGIAFVSIPYRENKGVKILSNLQITPKGIEYLQENSTMQKVKLHYALKDFNEIIPGI